MIVLPRFQEMAVQYREEMKYHNYMMSQYVFDDSLFAEEQYISHLKQLNFYTTKLQEMNALDFYGVRYYASSPNQGEVSPVNFS